MSLLPQFPGQQGSGDPTPPMARGFLRTLAKVVVLALMVVILLGAIAMCWDGIDGFDEVQRLYFCSLGFFLGLTYLVSDRVAILERKELWPRDPLSVFGLAILLVSLAFVIWCVAMLW